jgi:hypothetical protein
VPSGGPPSTIVIQLVIQQLPGNYSGSKIIDYPKLLLLLQQDNFTFFWIKLQTLRSASFTNVRLSFLLGFDKFVKDVQSSKLKLTEKYKV